MYDRRLKHRKQAGDHPGGFLFYPKGSLIHRSSWFILQEITFILTLPEVLVQQGESLFVFTELSLNEFEELLRLSCFNLILVIGLKKVKMGHRCAE